jgi:gamma-glutamylcyclotransferase (GGCT)/AIG2-like uncharacterized protein YtfP
MGCISNCRSMIKAVVGGDTDHGVREVKGNISKQNQLLCPVATIWYSFKSNGKFISMDLHKIIEGLNYKNFSAIKKLNETGDAGFSDEQKFVIRKYQPQHVFIIYGTLGPGRPNHHKIEHIKGTWKKAIIKGKLEARGWGADLGYYGYVKVPPGEEDEIEAFILFSDVLRLHWKLLDDFEGDEYERILAEFKLENGETGVGNIYALKK